MPNQKNVRWGILGSGHVLKKVGPAFSMARNAKLIAIASRNRTRAQIAADVYGTEKAYEGYGSLLNDDEVDAVLVALHNGLHCEWTVKAFEAGKHVLCEKPLACSVAEADSMFTSAINHKKLLMEGFMYRFHPQILEVKNRILQGDIGNVRHIRASYISRGPDSSNPRYWKDAGGGALMDLGCYCVNFCRFIAGQEPTQVYADATYDVASDVDITMSGGLVFSNGVSASFLCGFRAEGTYSAEIIGTEGKIVIPHPWLPPTYPAEYIIVRREILENIQVLSSDTSSHYLAPFVSEIEYFSTCIRNKNAPHFPPGIDAKADSYANARALDVLHVSARTGQPQRLALRSRS